MKYTARETSIESTRVTCNLVNSLALERCDRLVGLLGYLCSSASLRDVGLLHHPLLQLDFG